jgi:medium-chain acyl-[acyl-carrier-protein] hydrolase
MKGNAWISSPYRVEPPRFRLYCLPYAGRGASLYVPWIPEFLPNIEICPVQIPGRETRLSEPPITRMSALVDAIVSAIMLDPGVPFALFGHSMGGLIAFELARALQKRRLAAPSALLLSACYWPPIGRDDKPPLRDAPDAALLARLRELNGTSSQVLENRELVELILPIFRADTTLLETYEYEQAEPLAFPIHAFVGSHDPEVTRTQMTHWALETTATFTLNAFAGDHYFIHSCRDGLIRAIRDALRVGPRIAERAAAHP